jgi:hypothetical protein
MRPCRRTVALCHSSGSSPGSLVLAVRTAKWTATHSDGLSAVDWDKEVEHSARVAKLVLSHVTARYPELFQAKDVPWFVATDDEVPK